MRLALCVEQHSGPHRIWAVESLAGPFAIEIGLKNAKYHEKWAINRQDYN